MVNLTRKKLAIQLLCCQPILYICFWHFVDTEHNSGFSWNLLNNFSGENFVENIKIWMWSSICIDRIVCCCLLITVSSFWRFLSTSTSATPAYTSTTPASISVPTARSNLTYCCYDSHYSYYHFPWSICVTVVLVLLMSVMAQKTHVAMLMAMFLVTTMILMTLLLTLKMSELRIK